MEAVERKKFPLEKAFHLIEKEYMLMLCSRKCTSSSTHVRKYICYQVLVGITIRIGIIIGRVKTVVRQWIKWIQ